MIYLGYSFDEHYRYRPAFERSILAQEKKLPMLPFALGWEDTDDPNYIHMPAIMEFGRPIVQGGFFLDYLPKMVKEDDTILFVDTDAVFQRCFDYGQIQLLSNLCKWQVLIGPNRIHDRVELWDDEAPRVLPTRAYFQQYNGSLKNVPIGNCGFLAMQVSTYRAVFEAYKDLTGLHRHWFTHHAGTQLFLCAAMAACGIEHVKAPLSMSAHGHCGIPPDISCKYDRVYHQGDSDRLRSHAVFMKKCDAHPKYKASKLPQVDCELCWGLRRKAVGSIRADLERDALRAACGMKSRRFGPLKISNSSVGSGHVM